MWVFTLKRQARKIEPRNGTFIVVMSIGENLCINGTV